MSVSVNIKGREVALVYVRWFDSAIYQGGTVQKNDLSGIAENESAGLLIEDSSDSITLALDQCLDTTNLRLVLCIPRVNVRSIQYFKAIDNELGLPN